MEESTPNFDFSLPEDNLVRASQGQRLANYIIDLIVFYILIFIVGMCIAIVNPAFFSEPSNDNIAADIAERLLSVLIYAVYMSATEAVFQGRTLGKLITGTKAVNLDGSNISVSTAFGRGLSRAVPFCAFSALSTPCDPWQDRWTNTMVIDLKESKL